MGKRVIAIISIPQECGSDTIDFVSLETGKVIDTICITGFHSWRSCIETKEMPIGDPIILFDNNRLLNKNNVNHLKNEIGESIYKASRGYYTDEDCTIPASFPRQRDLDKKDYVITNVELVKQIPDPQYPNDDFWTTHIVKTTATLVEHIDVYVQDNDEFYHYFKNKFDIDLPFYSRQSMHPEDIIKMVAEKLEYEVINILRY